eukprot:scaffold4280_cov169-Ochromonas_danica.AAC.10
MSSHYYYYTYLNQSPLLSSIPLIRKLSRLGGLFDSEAFRVAFKQVVNLASAHALQALVDESMLQDLHVLDERVEKVNATLERGAVLHLLTWETDVSHDHLRLAAAIGLRDDHSLDNLRLLSSHVGQLLDLDAVASSDSRILAAVLELLELFDAELVEKLRRSNITAFQMRGFTSEKRKEMIGDLFCGMRCLTRRGGTTAASALLATASAVFATASAALAEAENIIFEVMQDARGRRKICRLLDSMLFYRMRSRGETAASLTETTSSICCCPLRTETR